MKVIVLGNQAAFPKALHHHTSLLVSTGVENILFDMGPGINSQFQKYVPIDKIHAIFITHMHPDHVLDLPIFIFGVYMYNTLGRGNLHVPIYLPKGGKSTLLKLLELFDFQKYLDYVSLIEVTEPVYIGPLMVTFSIMDHSITSYAYKVNSKEGVSMVYSGDTAKNNRLIALSENVDVLFLEATLFDKDVKPELKHMSAKQAGEVAKEARAKRLYLLHLWYEYDEEMLLKEAREMFPNTYIAKEDMEILI
ncbi:MAG: MBL fold metallo-hydrolase [Candidatus Asgardarchaeia archaeon]